MLFPYTYVPHDMEKLQVFVDFVFNDIWCNAPIGLVFSPQLFESNKTYKDLMSYFGFASTAPKRGKLFYKEVKSIYSLFSELKPEDIKQLKLWFKVNNSIENICRDPENHNIIRYHKLTSDYPKLGEPLAKFYRGLYDHSFLKLSKIREVFKGIDSHNEDFFNKNDLGICPFCGVNDLKGIHHTRREAYDHYLPKYRYPFNSLNFKNLAPACNECNSSYKITKDPALKRVNKKEEAKRRKSFYPYSDTSHQIDLVINLQSSDVENLQPDDINLSFGPDEIAEEIDTWRDVYGIDERYKAKCCSKIGGKYWLIQVLDEWKHDGRTPESFLRTLSRQTNESPYALNNFLRKAFLGGCSEAGIFNENPD